MVVVCGVGGRRKAGIRGIRNLGSTICCTITVLWYFKNYPALTCT